MSKKRLDRLLPILSGKERAMLVLQQLQRGEKPESSIVAMTPSAQAPEYNALIDLIRGANVGLGLAIILLQNQITTTSVKMAWLQTVDVLSTELRLAGGYIAMETDEPVTESGLAARREELAQNVDTLDVILKSLVSESATSSEPAVEDLTERYEEFEAVILDAVSAGTLPAAKRRTSLLLRWGDVYTWLGRELPLFPDWGRGYDIHPEHEAQAIARSLRKRHRVRDVVAQAPYWLDLPLQAKKLSAPTPGARTYNDLFLSLIATIRDEYLRLVAELAAIEVVLGGIALEFDGINVLGDEEKAQLAAANEGLDRIGRELSAYVRGLVAPCVDENDVALVWDLVDEAART